ncbi:putative alcohol dehydrogenase [Paenibacillus sp. TCA20]|uniref:quinone oxidoreductase family protein n=1 Tax=Paenibacillus sp. TCA20 TaxID=1499968 RepID=UPI0004D96AFF|nr:quinone oxidoreductase [Paenibacillus sp. TCA20]GAK41676.1 putative alcohol dehydrogenase [Paenibacillus sp. TCA20]
MKASVFREFGGPEVLHIEDVQTPALKPGCVLVRMKAVGLNYADVYRRKGNYHLEGEPPYILGYEGAGIVVETADDVTGLPPGSRVGFADVPHANSELVLVPQEKAIKLPSEITYDQAATVLLQGMTAHYLLNDSYPVQAGDEILVHAAAGGVGQLLVQLAKAKGARVLGVTSSSSKRDIALQAGADEVLLYNEGNWVDQARQWSYKQEGVRAAYDSVGSTLMDTFRAVQIKGHIVFYGMAGGNPVPVDPRMLMDTSKTLTGGDLWNHVTDHADRVRRANDLFTAITSGDIKLAEPMKFSLDRAAEAHQWIESRQSTGKILLIL